MFSFVLRTDTANSKSEKGICSTIAFNELILGLVCFTIKFGSETFSYSPNNIQACPRGSHTHSRSSSGLICLLCVYKNIHKLHRRVCVCASSCESVCVHSPCVRVACTWCVCIWTPSRHGYVHFVRPPIIQSSTPFVPVARRHRWYCVCWTGTFFKAWLLPAFDLLHAFNGKHKQSTFDHHWFDGFFLMLLYLHFCSEQISVSYTHTVQDMGELRTHSYENSVEWQRKKGIE